MRDTCGTNLKEPALMDVHSSLWDEFKNRLRHTDDYLQ